MAESGVKLKLLIDTKEQRVVLGEADKNFIDFLFNLLSLPLGTVIKLLENEAMAGSLGNVYESVETLSDTYLQPNQNKDAILKPKVSIFCSNMLLPNIIGSSYTRTFYLCKNTRYGECRHSVSNGPNAICPACNSYMNRVGTYVMPPIANTANTFYLCISTENGKCRHSVSDGPDAICPTCEIYMDQVGTYVNPPIITEEDPGGYVKGEVTYMVMDDLKVSPMSTISSLTLLNNFNIKDVGDLEEKLVNLDVNQGVKLMRASLQSKTVLTDVFLGNKKLG